MVPEHDEVLCEQQEKVGSRVDVMSVVVGVIVAGGLLGPAWMVWRVANRGFDFTDEGLYLLTARHPGVAYRTVTGGHFLIHPWFRLVDFDVAALRRSKLVVSLLTAGGLGWAIHVWARAAWPGWRPRHVEVGVGVGLVTIGGSLVFAWTPASPGYNDLSVWCTVLAVAMTLMVTADRHPASAAVALGAVQVLHLMVKWPGAVMVAIACEAVIFAHKHRVGLARFEVARALGAVGIMLFLRVAVLDLGRFARGLGASSKGAGGGVTSGSLATTYRHDLEDVLGEVWAHLWWFVPLIGAIAFALDRRYVRPRVAAGLAVALVLGLFVATWHQGFLRGGVRVTHYPVALPIFVGALISLVVLAKARRGSREMGMTTRLSAFSGIMLLLAAPWLQALGTNNRLTLVALLCGSCWIGFGWVISIVVRTANVALGVAAGCLTVLSGVIAIALALTALYRDPYRLATDIAGQNQRIEGIEALDGLLVDARQARFLTSLNDLYVSQDPATDQRMFAFWSVPGLVFLVGARQPGDGWLPISAPERVAAAIRAACADDPVLRDGGRPFLMVRGDGLPEVVAAAVGTCGAAFPDCYEVAGTIAMPPGAHAGEPISLWVPLEQCPTDG